MKMKTNDLKIELSRKLAEVNSRIIVLKDNLDELTEQSEALQDVIVDLENIRDNILVQFNEIENTTEAEHNKLPQLERNIYKSFSSFEESFSKAGSLTRSSKFANRERDVNFKNPLGNR
jgi:predicted  nucleic acid-binding Zn-ribbon protein